MKRVITKFVLPVAAALLMVVSLAACSTATAPAPTSSPVSSPNAAATAKDASTAPAVEDPMAPYPEPVTISWAIQTAPNTKLLDGDTFENNRYSRLIKEKLNIDLKVAFTADSSTSAYSTKLNTVIASGELPDIFKTQDMNVFMDLVSNNLLADLTSAADKYATDAVNAFFKRYSEAVDGVTINGKFYAIPRANDNFHEAPFLWIRDDWLAYAGGQYPKTVEEMVDMARKFATGDPDGNGVNGDTVGLAINKDLIRQNHFDILGLVSAFGVPGRDETQFYRDKNGKMTFSWIEPNVKPALKLLNSMYKEGLLNKEFTANSETALTEDVVNGKIGMGYGPNWGTWSPYNNTFKKDGTITRAYPIPTEAGYDYKVGIESNSTGQVTVVSAACAHPEAAIKILDLYVDTVNSSPENFDRYWNDEQARNCPVYTEIPNENYEGEIYDALVSGDASKLSEQAKPYYKMVLGFEDGTLKDDNAYGTWGQMSKTGSLQWILNKYEPDKAIVTSILGMKRPEVWSVNVSVLDTLTITTFTDIILGNKPVDFYDEYVKQWLASGGQQTLDELDKLYPAS